MEHHISFSKKLGIASTQFGGMLGAGVASGATVSLYFVSKNGYLAVIFPVLSLLFMFILYAIGLETARRYQLENSTQLYHFLYGDSIFRKVLAPIADITVVYMMIFAVVTAFSGAGTIFKQYWNIPVLLSAAVIAVLCILVIYFGMEVFQKLQSVLAVAMFLILVCSYVTALIRGGFPLLGEKTVLRWMPEGSGLGVSIWWAVSFGAIYMQFLPILLLAAKPLHSFREIRSTLGIGFLLNLSAAYLPSLAILAYSPAAMDAEVPAVYVVEQAGIPFAQELYLALLVFAFISTGASCLYTLGAQLAPFLPKQIEKPQARTAVIYVLSSVVLVLFSQLGLKGVLNLFAPVANVLCIFAMAVPLLFIATRKLKHSK